MKRERRFQSHFRRHDLNVSALFCLSLVICMYAQWGQRFMKLYSSFYTPPISRDIVKVNITSDIQNTIKWYSTFCQFSNIVKYFYWLSQQMQIFRLKSLGGILPESREPESHILISLVVKVIPLKFCFMESLRHTAILNFCANSARSKTWSRKTISFFLLQKYQNKIIS